MLEKLNVFVFGLPWPTAPLAIASILLLIAVLAFKTGSLTRSGAMGAWVLGFSVTWALRFEGLLLFSVFFVVSNIEGKIRKRALPQRKDDGPRNISQVMANGFMATIGAIWWLYSGSETAIVLFGACVAEAFSDTSAGELGRLSRKGPVSIITFRPVQKGVSGGVTLSGTFAGFGASAVIAILWAVLFKPSNASLNATFICLAGFAGCIIDSLLGGLVQAVYTDTDGRYSEEPYDDEGRKNTLVRGMPWMDNDMVNFVSNTFAGIFAMGLHLIFE